MTFINEHNSEQLKADARDATTPGGYTGKWWKEAVVYQIYPRSFKDSNADGIGDLRGVTSQLDYIKNLGVDVVWLSPMYDSPNADNGYDIRDYRKVMREFGTMADFDELLEGVKQRGMKMILDLVVNHTSDEHLWFVESRKAKDNPYRDYYIWREGKDGREPNDWVSYFSGSAWKKDDATGEYYLHLFAEKQPDLNWDNQRVREEVYDVMRFWLDKGVDGFRMDVIPLISKDPLFPDFPDDYDGDYGRVYASGAKLHDYVQEMNREVLSKYDVMTVGEAEGVTLAETPLLVDERRGELNMVFQFDVVKLDHESWRWKAWTLPSLKAIYTRFERNLDKHCWNALFLSNHDNPRIVSRFGNDSPPYRTASAKLLAMMLLTLKGTPFIYQGDELGMTNYPFTNIAEFDDIQVKNAWQAEVLTNQVDAGDYLVNLNKTSRDHARTPMQWDASDNAGFTPAAKAWLAVNPNYKEINAEQSLNDPDSIYNFYKKLIRLRKETPALIYGDYVDLDPQHPTIYAFMRTLGVEQFLILLNFSNVQTPYKLPVDMHAEELLFSNLREQDEQLPFVNLKGWEARLYKFNKATP